jgi:flagellar motor switch protein FliG
MSMLARYKKSSTGIMELVKLVEESPEPKRTNLMNMIRAEDGDFAAKIERRLFDYAKFRGLDEGLVAEVVGACPAKVLALAFYGETEDFLKLVERCLGNKFSEYKSEKEVLADKPPTPAQLESGRRKVVTEARKLESDGAFKLMDYDKIDSVPAGGGGTASLAGMTHAPAGSASAESGMPSIESFGIEAPPSGLLGERFENYVKKELGLLK